MHCLLPGRVILASESNLTQQVTPILRNLGYISLTVDADVLAVSSGKKVPGFGIDNFVLERNLSAPDLFNPTANLDALVVSGWPAVPDMEFRHGQSQALPFEFGERGAVCSQPVTTPFFHPDRIGSMVYNSHLIGFGVANVKNGFGNVISDVQLQNLPGRTQSPTRAGRGMSSEIP